MAFSRVFSAQTELLSGRIVSVEVDTSRGLNHFTIVGLGDRSVDEARDRVGSALKNAGFESPKTKNQKTVVSLSPAELKKEGAHFDLAIAIGFLAAEGLKTVDITRSLFVGELALDGSVRPVRGILAIALAASREGFRELYVPRENGREAALAKTIDVYPIGTLGELVEHVRKKPRGEIPPTKIELPPLSAPPRKPDIDLADIAGQESAKRALMIAAAGAHNILMYGPPGTGKTMLARALVGILPTLDHDAMLEVASIASIAGRVGSEASTLPPFRAPHHTSSHVAVIGGGASPRPGEVTLAHRGVLFADEFPEFDRRVIEGLREPLEEKRVSLSRAKGSASYPARFIFVAAMNPCPCGYKGSRVKQCTCTAADLLRYRRKISGPILDRIDMTIHVSSISYDHLSDGHKEISSEQVRIIVERARERAYSRLRAKKFDAFPNGELTPKLLPLVLNFSASAKKTLTESATRLGLSARSFHRLQKLSRTIADLGECDTVEREHVLEAIRYRPDLDAFV